MDKKILVVDDEEDVRNAVKAVLEAACFKAITASNAIDAIKILRKEKADLVLIDMFMRGVSGRELCKEIRNDKELKNLKCAFLTVAEFSEAGREELKKMKVLDYIKKPFDNDDLVRRVKKMLGQ